MSYSHYGKYLITPGPAYTHDSLWEFFHDDYDGPEDNRCGLGSSIEDCIEQIKEMEDAPAR